MNRVQITVVLSLAVTGCVSMGVPSTASYTPPETTIIENEINVAADSGEVWDILVEQLAKTFYVINNIDKESRLLNVSYAESNQPSLYVDCGESDRTYEFRGDITRYNYKTADSSAYKFHNGMVADTFFGYYQRKTDLDGRANIYVAPNADGGTTVTVNTRYIWSVNLRYTEMFTNDGVSMFQRAGFQPVDDASQVSFNTGKVGMEATLEGGDGITCVATGKFEDGILDILR